MRVWGEGEGEGKIVEQQMGALGNPCSPFSSSSLLLCIRRGFDKNPILGSAIHYDTAAKLNVAGLSYCNLQLQRILRIRFCFEIFKHRTGYVPIGVK